VRQRDMVSKRRTGSPWCVAVRRPGASVRSLRTVQSLPDERHPGGANWPSTATVSVVRQRGLEGFGARRCATRARTARGGQPRWRVRLGLCVKRGQEEGGCAARRVAVGKQGMSGRRGGRGVQSRACRAVEWAAATDAWDQVLSIPRVPVPMTAAFRSNFFVNGSPWPGDFSLQNPGRGDGPRPWRRGGGPGPGRTKVVPHVWSRHGDCRSAEKL